MHQKHRYDDGGDGGDDDQRMERQALDHHDGVAVVAVAKPVYPADDS